MEPVELKRLINELASEYPFVTEEQKQIVYEEYINSDKDTDQVRIELLNRLKRFVENGMQPYQYPNWNEMIARTAAELSERTEYLRDKELTDFVSYNISEGIMHIHLIPNSLMPYMREIINNYGKGLAKEKFDKYLYSKLTEALYLIGEIVALDPNIEKVSASSELVKKYEPLFLKAGFSLQTLSDEQLSSWLPNRPIEQIQELRHNAFINREDLLSIYGAKNKSDEEQFKQ
jgi:hypothetical protein